MFKRIFILAAIITLFSTPALSQDFPTHPMELVCTTRPGSSVAAWCQLLGQEFPKVLGVPMRVTFKSGGSQHEPVLYVEGKPADGHTIMHNSASFYGYFHLPHYQRNYQDHFENLAQVEQHIYGVALLRDNKYGIKTYEDLVAYAKKNPGKLAMGTNKLGSTHHRHQLAFLKAAGIGDAVRTVFYKGDGNVVKDVIGGHLPVGQASPRTWRAHIEAGTVIPLVIQSPTRLSTDKNWKDVRTVLEVGLKYDLPIHWQGLMLKKGTPPATRAKLVDALKKITSSPAYIDYLANGTHIVPNLKTDRDYLNEDMAKNQAIVKDFMIEYKIIKE